MKEQPNYYAIIPANVRYDEELRANEKLMYGEITALSNVYGYCFASNNYFAELYKVTPQAISKWISDLKSKGYIEVDFDYKNGTKEIDKRIIKIISTNNSEVSTNDLGGINKCLIPYKQTIKGDNTRVNNINNTTTSCFRNKANWEQYTEEEKTSPYWQYQFLTMAEYYELCEHINNGEVLDRYLLKVQNYNCKDPFETICLWAQVDGNYI